MIEATARGRAKHRRSAKPRVAKPVARAAAGVATDVFRMKDLCRLTGLERQAIHFYIQEGLVPEGRKIGRNMAFYGPEHLERIRLVKKLQREQFLPLKAIAAVLNGGEGEYEPDQRALLLEVKSKLEGRPVLPSRADTVLVAPLLQEHGLEERDLEEMVEAGLIAVTPSGKGRAPKGRIAATDAWQIETFAELRRAGFTRELGFRPRDLALYAEAVDRLFGAEKKLLLERLGHLGPEAIAERVERALPIIGAMLSRFHTMKARHFFAGLGPGTEPARAERK